MRALHAIATFLLLTGIGFFLFDLMYQWAAHDQIKVLSIENLWTDIDKSSFESVKGMADNVFPSDRVNLFFHLPAALVLLSISAIFYLPVKILTLLGAGKKPEQK